MTAKLTGVKLLWEDVKTRSWLFILMTVGSAALLPFGLQMRLSTLEYDMLPVLQEDMEWFRQAKEQVLLDVLGYGNSMVYFGCIVAAVISAVTGFAYLQSRRQVDFYHSLPLRRERLFLIRYLGGFLMTAVPYLLCAAAALLGVGGAHGALCRETAAAAAGAAGFYILLFLLFYTLAVLAVLLTGRILTGLLLTGFFYLYGALCTWLIQREMSFYFSTYYYTAESGNFFGQMPLFLPVTQGLNLSRALAAGETVPAGNWVLAVLSLGIALGLCILLYRKRPSEACGNAFSYRWMESVLKVAVAIPAALWVVSLLESMGYLAGTAMLLTAGGLAAVVLTGVFEFIYSQDLRNVWRHKVSGILALGGTLLILLAFQQDWFRYDSWLPEESQVESMAVYSSELDGVFTDSYWYIQDTEERILEEGLTEDFSSIYQLARLGAGETGGAESEAASGSVWMSQAVIHFHLKNGRDIYRQYTVPLSRLEETVGRLLEEKASREIYYPTQYRNVKNVTDLSFRDWNNYYDGNESLPLGRDEIGELLEILREEYLSCSYRELKAMEPVGILYLGSFQDNRGPYMGTEIGYYIYPSFEKTLAYLNRRGIQLLEKPDLSRIVSVQLDYLTELELASEDDMTSSAVSELYAFNTKEDIEALFGQLKRVRQADYLTTGEYADVQIMFADGVYSSIQFQVKDGEAFRAFLDEHSGAQESYAE